MQHIGQVMKNMKSISVAINTDASRAASQAAVPNCPLCHDAGFLRVDVPVNHPSFGRIFPCQCKVREREQRDSDRLLRLSNLEAFAHYSFANFDHEVEGVEDAYRKAVQYARNPDGWIFLHGKCGVGKTHLAVAVALYAQEHQKLSVYFAVVPDLLDHLRATFDPKAGEPYDELFSMIRGSGLLVLDDLGTENTTPWAREKLYQLVNHRYNERLPTIITSNQDHKLIDERVLSRLLDTRLTTEIVVDAEDYRRRGRHDYVRGRRR